MKKENHNRKRDGLSKLSVKDVTEAYNRMIPRDTEPNSHGIYNYYHCSAGHIIHTKDVDKGTTPFMINCPTCGLAAKSGLYRVPESEVEKTTHEWFRPSLEYCLSIRNKESKRMFLDHILNGGLEIREIK